MRLHSGLRTLYGRSFRLLERLGVHVTPNHFYFPVPDTRSLDETLWKRQSELVGIDLDEAAQIELLASFAAEFRNEYEAFPREPTGVPHQFFLGNTRFDAVDAEILYCMIRRFRPARVFEIGSGYSTYLSAQALLKNRDAHGQPAELIACEPYPGPVLQAGFPGLSRLIAARVQDVPLTEFERLDSGDILFIDSSHVLKIGSDVQYEFLEILPRLKKGVLVHVHDIFLPAEYPRAWVLEQHKFWNEQYLLQAFLSFNSAYKVLWGGSFMHLEHPHALSEAFSSYDRRRSWPGSFWIRRTA